MQTTTEKPETALLPDAGLGGPAQLARTVRVTSVTFLPAGRRPVTAKPRIRRAGATKRKAQAAAPAKARAPREPWLTARERVTVPGMIGLTAAAYFVPGVDIGLAALCMLAVPLLSIFSVVAFVADFGRACFNKPALCGFGIDAMVGTFFAAVFAVLMMPPMNQSPVMLDLNGDERLGTTGASTARVPAGASAPRRTVAFDLAGSGQVRQIAWSDGGGDAFVVDDRDGGATRAARGTGVIDGKRLFGDEGGRFASGYDKLARLDANGDGALIGAELAGLAAWIDDGDARLAANELKGLQALGVTRLDVRHAEVRNARGEDLDQAGFVIDGRRGLTEDVWFAVAR